MFVLSKETKDFIKSRSKNYEDIRLIFNPQKKNNIFGRGNPLLARRRFKTIETVDSELERLISED